MCRASLAYRLAVVVLVVAGAESVARGQGQITRWTFPSGFNTTNPAGNPTGTASLLGSTAGGTGNGILTADAGGGWSITSFQAVNAGSGTAGVQFNASTSGAANTNIVVRFDQLTNATASRFYRLDTTTDGSSYTPGAVFSVAPDSGGRYNPNQTINLSSISGLGNNANFGFRIVSVFDPAGSTYTTNNTGATYAAASELRLDNVVVTAAHVWNGGSGSYTDGTKYAGGTAPTTTGTVLFTNSGGTVSLPTGTTALGQVVFGSSAGGYILDTSARTLTLSGGVLNESSNNQTVNPTLRLTSGPQTITNAGAGTLTLRTVTLANTANQADEAQLTLAGSGRIVVGESIGGNGTSGEIAVRKVGTGTALLNATSTFGGIVAIDAGTLGGTGIVPGSVVVAGGATVLGGNAGPSPGNTAFTIGDSLTFGNGAGLRVKLTNGAVGSNLSVSGGSRVVVTGVIDKGAADTINLIVDADSSIDLSGNTTYTRRLLTYGTLGSGFTAGTYTQSSPGPFTLTGGSDLYGGGMYSFPTWTLTIGGGAFDLTFTPTPEPTTVFGLVAGVVALAGVVRRRRRK